MCGSQAGFRPCRVVLTTFLMMQILEHRHKFRKFTNSPFHDRFDQSRVTVSHSFMGQGYSFHLSNLLFGNSQGQVRAYGNISPAFTKTNDNRWRCLLPYFFFNFITETVITIALSSCENSCTDISLDGKVIDLEYADDVPMSVDPSNMSVFLHLLNDSVGLFGMDSVPSVCKMLLQNRIGSKPKSILH